MLRRIVLFKQIRGADPQAFEAAMQALAQLDQMVPNINSWWVGVGTAVEGDWDAALIADFPSEESVVAYDSHPSHIEVATRISQVSEFAIFNSR